MLKKKLPDKEIYFSTSGKNPEVDQNMQEWPVLPAPRSRIINAESIVNFPHLANETLGSVITERLNIHVKKMRKEKKSFLLPPSCEGVTP